jgi:hypothetical protein
MNRREFLKPFLAATSLSVLPTIASIPVACEKISSAQISHVVYDNRFISVKKLANYLESLGAVAYSQDATMDIMTLWCGQSVNLFTINSDKIVGLMTGSDPSIVSGLAGSFGMYVVQGPVDIFMLSDVMKNAIQNASSASNFLESNTSVSWLVI